MALARTIDFNDGADGATLAVGGGIDSVVGTPQYSTAQLVHGARGMIVPAGTAATYFRSLIGSIPITHSGSAYIKPIAQPTSSSNVIQFSDNTDAAVFTLSVNSDGKFRLLNEAGASQAASVNNWTLGQYYRWDWQADFSTPLSPAITWRIFDSPHSVTPLETVAATFATTRTPNRWRIGGVGSSTAVRSYGLDTIRLYDALEWAGPFGTNLTDGRTLQYHMNRKAGTLVNGIPTLDAQGAANVWAGTTGKDIVGALNIKAGNTFPNWKELVGVLNQLAGTTGLEQDGAAASIP